MGNCLCACIITASGDDRFHSLCGIGISYLSGFACAQPCGCRSWVMACTACFACACPSDFALHCRAAFAIWQTNVTELQTKKFAGKHQRIGCRLSLPQPAASSMFSLISIYAAETRGMPRIMPIAPPSSAPARMAIIISTGGSPTLFPTIFG